MNISILLAQEILKLFAIMCMGYGIVKTGILRSAESKSLSAIMVYLISPCMILGAFQVDYTPAVRDGLLLAFAAAIAVNILFILITIPVGHVLGLDIMERAAIIYPNAGMLVFPLVKELLGADYIIYSSAFVAVQQVLLWTHCRRMMCYDEAMDWKKILCNINIVTITIGIVMFFTRIRFPVGVQDTLDMVGDMTGPIGMLLSGMVIADIPLRSVFARVRNYLTVVLRLFVYPMIVLVMMRALVAACGIPDAKQILLTVYLASVTPACATVTSMAQLYNKDAPRASSLYVLTTILCVLTMPVTVGLYEWFV